MTFPMVASKGRILLWSAAFVLLGTAPTLAADFTRPARQRQAQALSRG